MASSAPVSSAGCSEEGHDRRIVSIPDIARVFDGLLTAAQRGYINSGAAAGVTLSDNVNDFSALRIRPRVLVPVDAPRISTSCSLLGEAVDAPISLAPCAFHGMLHEEGECATARAVCSPGLRVAYCMSTMATRSVGDIATAAPSSLRWFQLYVFKDRSVTQRLIRACEASGVAALVLTVDRPVLGTREEDVRLKFELPAHLSVPNLQAGGLTGSIYAAADIDSSLSWGAIAWLRSLTRMPLVVKGVLTPEDAVLAVQAGVDAVWVSNHGARQLDSVPSGIDALPGVVAAVRAECARSGREKRVEVYVDGGIRRGTDVFKALACGADHVWIARPLMWGLAWRGQQGVEWVLRTLIAELRQCMQLAGVTRVQDITPAYVTLHGAGLLRAFGRPLLEDGAAVAVKPSL